MTVNEFYKIIDGNYEEILSRLVTDERIHRFLVKFLETDDMNCLKKGWEENDRQKIFDYSHRLKGIALNLSLTNLAKYTSHLTELYRNNYPENPESGEEAYQKCCKEYELLISYIKKINCEV